MIRISVRTRLHFEFVAVADGGRPLLLIMDQRKRLAVGPSSSHYQLWCCPAVAGPGPAYWPIGVMRLAGVPQL